MKACHVMYYQSDMSLSFFDTGLISNILLSSVVIVHFWTFFRNNKPLKSTFHKFFFKCTELIKNYTV